jgi:hypothetical protein
MTTLPHPKKTLVTLAEARQWSPQQYLIQRKFDGELARREVAGAILLGELVTERSGAFLTAEDRALIARHGTFFAAFTVESVFGDNLLNRTTRERWGILCSFAGHFPPDVILAAQTTVPASLTTEEGYVAHGWDAPWGTMLAVKQASIYVCKVSSTGGTQSVGIVDAATGEARGSVKLGGGKSDHVRVGSVIRVEGMSLTDDGKIRQPKPCREWLVQL